MRLKVDRNLFEQTGLDSGSLTMLGTVVHGFQEPGEYRGVVCHGDEVRAVFYLSVDQDSPVAHASIDLASLAGDRLAKEQWSVSQGERLYKVNPSGYVTFHVSGGSGGFYVLVRRATPLPTTHASFDSRELGERDIFSAAVLRPGTYSVLNTPTKAGAQVIVSYPEIGKTAYVPPAPRRVKLGPDGFEPKRIRLKPAQGLVFDIKAPARIKLRLVKPDNGPVLD